MVLWMNRHARGMKGEIETQLQQRSGAGSRWGIFLFVFLMIFREGVETVLMLTAVRFDTSGVLDIAGVVLGLGLAVLFGVSFVRGTIRINLRSFFRMTTVILYGHRSATGYHRDCTSFPRARCCPAAARRWL